ncbi:unnamed protein product [Darwinula stevensoni]|uniref:Uncharacterized protein n=1 Tax=Darwinula stevensoni TaxID=69355 RepID=A0A7R8X6X6_9CRUS|nr:unnamed protein product [Darwinula stevensoni]CAG0881723.1 unnamed protein product [Darwinula stevensoni]
MDGFLLFGHRTRECMSTGQWSHPEPFCAMKIPSSLRILANSQSITNPHGLADGYFETCSHVEEPGREARWDLDLRVTYDVRLLRFFFSQHLEDNEYLGLKAYEVVLPTAALGQHVVISLYGITNHKIEVCEVEIYSETGTTEKMCEGDRMEQFDKVKIWGRRCLGFDPRKSPDFLTASRICQSYGGFLPQNIDRSLFDLLRILTHSEFSGNKDVNAIWIGAQKEAGSWKWTDGTAVMETVFQTVETISQTDSDLKEGSCPMMAKDNWLWTEGNCTSQQPPPAVLCQFDPQKCTLPRQHTGAILKLSDESLGVGTIASYSCQDGVTLFGKYELKCQKDGQWNDQEPYCNVPEYAREAFSPEEEEEKSSAANVAIYAAIGAVMGVLLVALIAGSVLLRRQRRSQDYAPSKSKTDPEGPIFVGDSIVLTSRTVKNTHRPEIQIQSGLSRPDVVQTRRDANDPEYAQPLLPEQERLYDSVTPEDDQGEKDGDLSSTQQHSASTLPSTSKL